MDYGTPPPPFPPSPSQPPLTNTPQDTLLDAAIDSGYLPSPLIRLGARQMTRGRLRDITAPTLEEQQARKQAFVDALRGMSIAIEQDKANEQHYEVGVGVLAACLGPRMKYSSALWSRGARTIAEAEDAMLDVYLERMEVEDGMRVLDLGWVVSFLVMLGGGGGGGCFADV